MTPDFSAESAAERVVIQASLDRGYLSRSQLSEATRLRDERRAAGQRVTLLSVLQERFLPANRIPELVALHRQVDQDPKTVAEAAPGETSLSEQPTVLPGPAQRAPRDSARVVRPARSSSGSYPQVNRSGSGSYPQVNRARSDSGSLPRVARSASGETGRTLRPTPAASSSGVAHAQARTYGRYQVLDELGKGGMGTVFRARDPSLGREVALKVVQIDVRAGTELERFRREAHAAASLSHPYLVPVFDFGVEGETPWMVMELVPGDSLAVRLKREGSLNPAEAAAIVAKVARGLHAAHAQGVLHRDLKPGNILVDPGGIPRLTDFGLARAIEGGTSLTQSGQLLGTPSYMSPEQALGELHRIGPATDVYGLGATFYHLLVGEPPFVGKTAVQIVTKVLNSSPQPPGERAKLPAGLDAICMRAMARDLDERFPSAQAFAEALEQWASPRARPQPTRKPAPAAKSIDFRHPGLISGALGLVGVAIFAGVMFSHGESNDPEPADPPTGTDTPQTPDDPPEPESPGQGARRLLARAQAEPQQATELVAEALVLAPDYAPALLAGAQLAIARGDLKQADASITQVLDRSPENGFAHSLHAEVFAAQGRIADAMRAVTAARKHGPGQGARRLDQVERNVLFGEFKRSRSVKEPDFRRTAALAARVLELDPGAEELMLRRELGYSLFRNGDREGSVAEFERARRASPVPDARLEFLLAESLFDLGRLEPALVAAGRAAEASRDGNPKLHYDCHTLRAQLLRRSKRPKLALEALEHAIETDSSDPMAYYLQARTYADLEDWPMVLAVAQIGVRKGCHPTLLYPLQISAHESQGNWARVRAVCTAWIEAGVDPRNAQQVEKALAQAEAKLSEQGER